VDETRGLNVNFADFMPNPSSWVAWRMKEIMVN
jgi:hypothetical protein